MAIIKEQPEAVLATEHVGLGPSQVGFARDAFGLRGKPYEERVRQREGQGLPGLVTLIGVGAPDGIRLEINKIAEKPRRFGYRRIGVMLERAGMIMNEKTLYRIYREEGLSVRPHQRWSPDFLSDTFGASLKFRLLAVNDDSCCENLCLVPDTSISGARLALGLDALVKVSGKPTCIVSDRRRFENDPGDRFPEEGRRIHRQGHLEMGER